MCTPCLAADPSRLRAAELEASKASLYRAWAFEAAAAGFGDAAKSFSIMADLAQLRAEEAFR